MEGQQDFLVIETELDQSPPDVLHFFAWDEMVCRRVGEGAMPPVAHLWRHPNALVLGLRDRRLPNAAGAMERLRGEGVSVGVRNSGGAAVPLDRGVVNLSLVFPYAEGTRLDFHNEFRMMAGLIGEAAAEWAVVARSGEIRGAYCPGEYDLAIGGRKFCGIAQRRQLRGYVVSAFVVVEGSGAARTARARSFYEEATGGLPHADDPKVAPDTVASLQELAGVNSAEAFMRVLRRQLEQRGGRFLGQGQELVDRKEAALVAEELRRRYDA
ncbi:MAG: ywfL [Paenibacillaceae bacterium]|jgi:octanoyl-[GcvH]:protein N-octanoyltransferase|nr:ywfL [Paenibacillaceae bacterium]